MSLTLPLSELGTELTGDWFCSTMFAFLFSWTDTHWLPRRKVKMFRFTPTPVSSASVFWWCGKGGFAERKCLLDDTLDRWFDERFPPLSIYYGGKDYLVLTEPLLERLERKENVHPIRVEKLDELEVSDIAWLATSCRHRLNLNLAVVQHCDFHFSSTAVEDVFFSLRGESLSKRSRTNTLRCKIHRFDQPDSFTLPRRSRRRPGSEVDTLRTRPYR